MAGNEDSDLTEPNNPLFLYDEGLPPLIGEVLAHVGFSLEVGEKGKNDKTLIAEMGAKHQTWITKDDRARVEHETDILAAGISIVFVRGLSHHGLTKSSLRRNTINLKEVLLMLVSKLDAIQSELSPRRPRYFILFMRTINRPQLAKYSTLRQVWERLAK